MALVVCYTPSINATPALFSSLKESLLPYLDVKRSELATELDELFPQEILLSHVIATWKAAAVFKRERRES